MIKIDRTVLLRILLAVAIVATVIFIWSNSLANADESTKMSDSVIAKVKPIIDPKNRIMDDVFEMIVRKAAHFCEFALLSAEVCLFVSTIKGFGLMVLPSFLLSVAPPFVCAVVDELLQLTSAGRACRFTDVLIDLGGIITGVLFVWLIRFIVQKLHKTAG